MNGKLSESNFDRPAFLSDMAGKAAWDNASRRNNYMKIRVLKSAVPKAVALLAPRQRQLIEMYYFERKRQNTIAKELNIDDTTVSRMLSRAKNNLQTMLSFIMAADFNGEDEDEDDPGKVIVRGHDYFCPNCGQALEWRDAEKDMYDRTLNELRKKVAYYEDLKEKGLLIVLPAKVGDTVYFIRGRCFKSDKENWKAVPIKVTQINTKISKDGNLMPFAMVANTKRYPFESIGKTVFLTKEDAERRIHRYRNPGQPFKMKQGEIND